MRMADEVASAGEQSQRKQAAWNRPHGNEQCYDSTIPHPCLNDEAELEMRRRR